MMTSRMLRNLESVTTRLGSVGDRKKGIGSLFECRTNGGPMTKADEEKIDRLVGKLRSSQDELTHLIKSDPEAALRLLDKARDQLYDLVSAYDAVLKKMSRS